MKCLPLVLFASLPCVAACRRPEPGAVRQQGATVCTYVVSFRDFAISFSPRTCQFVIYFGFLSMILLLPLWLRAGRREDSVPRGATSSGATLQCCFGRCTTVAHDKQT